MQFAARDHYLVFEDRSEIHRTLTTISKSYRELVEKLFNPESGCFDSNSINNNTRLLLEVQGSEIITKYTNNLRWDIIHTYNVSLINRLDVVMDTGYYVREDGTEAAMLQCMFRQINGLFMPDSWMGKMLMDGFKQWENVRAHVYIGWKRDTNSQLSRLDLSCLGLVFDLCRRNTSPVSGAYREACARVETLGLERVVLRQRSTAKKPLRPPRIQLATKTPRRDEAAKVVDNPVLEGGGSGGGGCGVGDDEVIVIDD